MLRLTFASGDLIIDHRCALAPVHSLHCLDSEDEVRRLLLIALTNPTALEALRRFFARWNSEAWRVTVIKDRTLIERVARMTVNGPLAAFVVHEKRTLRVAHMAAKLATGKLMLKTSEGALANKTHVPIEPPAPVNPAPPAELRLAESSPAAATVKANADQQVRNFSVELRIEEVLRRTPPYLPQAMRADFMALLSPESLAITVGVLAVWAVSHAFGIGFIIDALLVIAGAVLFGLAIVDVARKLHNCLQLAATAQTDKDLDESAKLLADVVAEIGVAAFVALITHGASRTVSSAAKGKPPAPKNLFTEAPKKGPPQLPSGKPTGPIAAVKAKPKSLRQQYLGKTPGKNSKTGRLVKQKMKEDGKLKIDLETGEETFQASDGKWYPIKDADMAHSPKDAVTYWNETGRKSGPKSAEVRKWMREPDNYTLEHYSKNRSDGAKLGERYQPPEVQDP